MRELLRKIMQNHESANISTEKFLKENYNDIYTDIMNYTHWMKDDTTFITRTFYWYNELTEYLTCEHCGKPIYNVVRFWKYKKNDFVTPRNTVIYCNECKVQGSRPIDSKVNSFSRSDEQSLDEYYDDEYINNWAIAFAKENGEKPLREDFVVHFNRNFPRKDLNRKFNRSLFNLHESYLEATVCRYIKSLGYTEQYVVDFCHCETDFVRNKMIKDNATSKRLQLDIYFPMLNLAFEVQDFATHSRISDTEPNSIKFIHGYKHGPTYHENKRKVAKSHSIILIDLWEDDIRSEKFKEELDIWLKVLI